MSSRINQKQRILRIMQYLLRNTDEEHGATVADIMNNLSCYDISANRKTIYDDIETLNTIGMDIVKYRDGYKMKYHVVSRDFDDAELKLLIDGIQISHFIPKDKTHILICKLECLTSVFKAELINHHVYISNRVKSMEESCFINVDIISTAISNDRKISFRYFEYNEKKEKVFHRNGGTYSVCPFNLVYSDQNYYMIAYSPEHQAVRHYRVDRMADVKQSEEPRSDKEKYLEIDIARYTSQVFGMFTGTGTLVKCRFHNSVAGDVLDRFGNDIILIPDGKDHFDVMLNVIVSAKFLSWIIAFGSNAEILSPPETREAMVKLLSTVSDMYTSTSANVQQS